MTQPETPAMNGLRLYEQGPASFLHNVGESYYDLAAVTGVDRYSGRVLCATLAEDTIHLAPELQEELPVIRSHYEGVGLATAGNVVWDMSLDSLSPDSTPSVFLYDERVHHKSHPTKGALMQSSTITIKTGLYTVPRRKANQLHEQIPIAKASSQNKILAAHGLSKTP